MNDGPFLMSRAEAAQRYGMSERQLDGLCKRYKDFPVLYIGRRVMICREKADEWFLDRMREVIDIN